MSLFATIQTSANALQVSELGLQVVSNNVANANTPGYIRQELVQSTGPAVLVGGVLLGYGVRANGVIQKFDDFTAGLRLNGDRRARGFIATERRGRDLARWRDGGGDRLLRDGVKLALLVVARAEG